MVRAVWHSCHQLIAVAKVSVRAMYNVVKIDECVNADPLAVRMQQ